MSWFSADFICPGCDTRFTDLIERELKDEAHNVICPGCLCEHALVRSIGCPMPMTASLPDGVRLKRDGDYARMKDAIKLERKAYNHKHDSPERKELMGAAQKLKEGKLPS